MFVGWWDDPITYDRVYENQAGMRTRVTSDDMRLATRAVKGRDGIRQLLAERVFPLVVFAMPVHDDPRLLPESQRIT